MNEPISGNSEEAAPYGLLYALSHNTDDCRVADFLTSLINFGLRLG